MLKTSLSWVVPSSVSLSLVEVELSWCWAWQKYLSISEAFLQHNHLVQSSQLMWNFITIFLVIFNIVIFLLTVLIIHMACKISLIYPLNLQNLWFRTLLLFEWEKTGSFFCFYKFHAWQWGPLQFGFEFVHLRHEKGQFLLFCLTLVSMGSENILSLQLPVL